MRNYWIENSALLSSAYLRGPATIPSFLVTRAIARHVRRAGQRVLDVGGGDARQAVDLARAGHGVVVLDPDPTMLAAARERLAAESPAVRARVELRQGVATDDPPSLAGGFALVCCHSVLMYEDEPARLLDALAAATCDGGVLSIVSLNPDAIALRSGLQGRWSEAVESLTHGRQAGEDYLPTSEPSRAEVEAHLRGLGFRTLAWYGIGVFTDHLVAPVRTDAPEQVLEAEWLAGERDPYRSVARCFHLLCQQSA